MAGKTRYSRAGSLTRRPPVRASRARDLPQIMALYYRSKELGVPWRGALWSIRNKHDEAHRTDTAGPVSTVAAAAAPI